MFIFIILEIFVEITSVAYYYIKFIIKTTNEGKRFRINVVYNLKRKKTIIRIRQ